MKALTLEEIRAAQARITGRHAQAAARINEIEDGATLMLIRYANGEIDKTVLDALANELPQLREIAAKDNAAALEHFDLLAAGIMDKERADRNRKDMLAQKQAWAEKWNSIIARTTGFSLLEVEGLVNGRPADLPGGGPAWHRFESMRAAFGALPDGSMTYAEYARLEPYNPE